MCPCVVRRVRTPSGHIIIAIVIMIRPIPRVHKTNRTLLVIIIRTRPVQGPYCTRTAGSPCDMLHAVHATHKLLYCITSYNVQRVFTSCTAHVRRSAHVHRGTYVLDDRSAESRVERPSPIDFGQVFTRNPKKNVSIILIVLQLARFARTRVIR